MITSIARRFGVAILTVFGASVFSFILLRKVPGDPAKVIAGDMASSQTIEALHASMGLNGSLFTQYGKYMSALFHGDFGYSYSTGENVNTLMGQRLPATIELGLTAMVMALGMAVVFAGLAVYSRSRVVDRLLRTVSSIAMGAPSFWIALVLIMLLSVKLGILPGPEGRLSPGTAPPPHHTGLFTVDALLSGQFGVLSNAVWHLMLPAFVIALAPFAFLTRLFRASLRGTLRETFIMVARSHGLRRRPVFVKHASLHGLLALVPASSLLFADLLTGSILVETVFNWPGIGSMTANAILQKDFSVVQAVLLLAAFAYVVVSFASDVVLTVVDPRTRVGAR